MLVFLVCGGRDFLKFRPVRLGTMASALALDAVLSTTAGATVVDGFAHPSAAGSFNHSSKKKKTEEEAIVEKPSTALNLEI